MKIPPRAMFVAQVLAATWASLVQIAVTCFLFSNLQYICGVDPTQPNSPPRYTCQSQRTFFSTSVIFGLLSPYRTFAKRQDYQWVNIMFLVSAVILIPTWYLAKRYLKSNFKLISWPLIFTSTAATLCTPIDLYFTVIRRTTLSSVAGV